MKTTKFLGVFIDDHLNFKHHIEYLVKKLSKYVGLFFKLRHLLPQAILLTLYKTLFEPHLNYCNIIWCNTYHTYLKKLEIPQKKVICAISWSDFNAPTRSIFLGYGILRLNEYNIFHNACTMYQVVFGLNSSLCELFPHPLSPAHSPH